MRRAAYTASEDSALLRSALGGFSGGLALEIGAGNGGNLIDLFKRYRLVAGTDIALPETTDWRDSASYVLADGATCFRDAAFDLVTFNPPYLANEVEDAAVDGGKELEVPRWFLSEALRVVKKDGTIVFLANDQADPKQLAEICAREAFVLERIGSERVFFEELSAYVAKKDPMLR
jgi:release factor glutamine methyltransferase